MKDIRNFDEWTNCIKGDCTLADKHRWQGPIPESAEEIVFKAFRDREDLVDVTLPKNLSAIGLSAFINCTNLRSVSFPRTLKTVGTWAFAGTSLADIRYEGTIEEFDQIEFGASWCDGCKPVVHCSNGDIDFGSEPFYVETLSFAGTKAEWQNRYGQHPWFNRRIRTVQCTDGDIVAISPISPLARRLRGDPSFIARCSSSELNTTDWLYLLEHCPSNAELVSKCGKWDCFSRDDLCDLLCNHPQLKDHCPAEVWNKFGLGHWARLVSKGGRTFAEKMSDLGVTDRISDWCCAEHWAEEYSTLFVRCAAASPHDEKVRHIAESSAIDPNYGKVGGSRHVRYHDDRLKHIQWLASIAEDFTDMAQNTDASHAERYALVAEAANYEIQALQGKE